MTYLALQNELGQLVAVYPMQFVEHGHAAHDPPAVADVFFLLWPPIQASILELSFAEPSAQLVVVHQIEPARDGQCSHTREHLTGVGFGPWTGAVTSIEVGTRMDMAHGLVHVDEAEQAH